MDWYSNVWYSIPHYTAMRYSKYKIILLNVSYGVFSVVLFVVLPCCGFVQWFRFESS